MNQFEYVLSLTILWSSMAVLKCSGWRSSIVIVRDFSTRFSEHAYGFALALTLLGVEVVEMQSEVALQANDLMVLILNS